MKKYKKFYMALILLVIVVLFFVINNIKICSINPHEADYIYELIQDKYKSENVDKCVEV